MLDRGQLAIRYEAHRFFANLIEVDGGIIDRLGFVKISLYLELMQLEWSDLSVVDFLRGVEY